MKTRTASSLFQGINFNRVISLVVFVCLLLSTNVFAQRVYDIRRSLFLRERLAALKSEVERLATGEIDPKNVDLSSKQQIAENELSDIEKEIELVRAMKGPMAEHYIRVLQKQVGEIKMFFPVLSKRAEPQKGAAEGKRSSKGTKIIDNDRSALLRDPQNVSPGFSPQKKPFDIAQDRVATEPGLPDFASQPSEITATSNTQKTDTNQKRSVEPFHQEMEGAPKSDRLREPSVEMRPLEGIPTPTGTSLEDVLSKFPPFPKKGKGFFQPIGLRTLLLRQLKKPGPIVPPENSVTIASPSEIVSLASATGVPTASPTTISPQVKLPPPVKTPPTAITPISPAPGNDPQVNNNPGMRPLAVMIENHVKARPQTGLGEAEIVYEIPVEGGITRFMALYYHVADLIGPIRSCRDYFIDRALEVNALYVHCGGSPQGYEHIEKTVVLAIDEISNGEPFFRDNSRKAPHNLYSRMPKIIENMNKKHPMQLPYQRIPLLFGNPPTFSTIPNRGLTIRYHGNYFVTYRFNPQFNVYDRYMNGEQHLDRVTLRPVSPGTVILQEAVMKTIDDKGRQDISFIGQGKAYILTGGTILKSIWQKAAPREFTKFFDETGKPILFSNKSPIWIQVISPINPVAFDPPLPMASAQGSVPGRPLPMASGQGNVPGGPLPAEVAQKPLEEKKN